MQSNMLEWPIDVSLWSLQLIPPAITIGIEISKLT